MTPVVAGPFNLGTIVTRAAISVDPRTAQITVTTDPLPQIVKGVPADLREINAVIDRPGFMFNPTNCSEAAFSGTALGTAPPGGSEPGETAGLSSRFQVGSCRSLEFHPKVAVATGAKASKANGASLSFKISYPKGAQGRQAWFNEAKFDLPKQLPARLTTLQKACLAATFETNPAACPAHSLIGHAVVHTQVLPAPLEGPVYFVSYGGAKFPEAVLVLKGDNVTVDLHGETFINNKTGITSATFRNTPGVPFESIEVSIPTGPFSEFGVNLPAKAKYSFCGQKLALPTLFKAQNGLEIHQRTPSRSPAAPKQRKQKQHVGVYTGAGRAGTERARPGGRARRRNSATRECYHEGMASRYPRLGVTRDPDVQRALALTEPLLDPAETRSAAAQIRALTLRGAEAVLAGSASETRLQARLAERYGATPAKGSLLDLDLPPGEPDPAGSAPASEALHWVRGE